jgi:GntP family gluconate:H+ symporter
VYTFFILLLSILLIVLGSTRLKIHPFLTLLLAAFFFGIFTGIPATDILNAVNEGFGKTIGSIGIVIVLGILIGAFLERSGGAVTLAESVLKITGRKNVSRAMAAIGYIVSIPVFCDSGYIILTPLNKSLAKKAGISLAGPAIALSIGLMATHVMVPPTPGPVAAAGILGADLGLVITWGIAVSIPAVVITNLLIQKVASGIDLDPLAGETNPDSGSKAPPKAMKAFLPILVPIVLIMLRSVAQLPEAPFGTGAFYKVLAFAGQPVTALFAGLLFALALPEKLDKDMLSASGWAGQALKDAAIIILITGAGGAFGNVLQHSDLSALIGDHLTGWQLGIFAPFLLAAALKTAQGSSTVAIITSASLMAPLLVPLGFDTAVSKAFAVLAIGAGSAVVSHANDSFFWVVTQMSGMDVKTGYKLQSLGTGILGFIAIILLFFFKLMVG